MNLNDCFSLFTKKETLDDDNKPVSEHTIAVDPEVCVGQSDDTLPGWFSFSDMHSMPETTSVLQANDGPEVPPHSHPL